MQIGESDITLSEGNLGAIFDSDFSMIGVVNKHCQPAKCLPSEPSVKSEKILLFMELKHL